MPSVAHEAPLVVLRERPGLVGDLLRSALGIEIPAHDAMRIEDPGFIQPAPAEYRANLVLTLLRGGPVLGLVVEVQLARDPSKSRSWPLYVAALHARLGCPCALVVVTPSSSVARWARRPIVGFQDGAFRPWVLGPEEIPVVTDPGQARANPELGVLSVLAHGQRGAGLAVARAVFEGIGDLDPPRATLYGEVVLLALGRATRRALEAEMDLRNYEFKSDVVRKWFGAGRAEGRQEGRQLAQTESILAVLAARGIPVSGDARARVEACRDTETLRRWLARAATVPSADEIFD